MRHLHGEASGEYVRPPLRPQVLLPVHHELDLLKSHMPSVSQKYIQGYQDDMKSEHILMAAVAGLILCKMFTPVKEMYQHCACGGA